MRGIGMRMIGPAVALALAAGGVAQVAVPGSPGGNAEGATEVPRPAFAGAPQTPPDDQWTRLGRDHFARVLARLAMVDLRAVPLPDETDYAIASAILGLALDQTPDDQDLLRRRIEAAFNAGQEQLALELTRRLVQLDPADTVAQLRLITAAVGESGQTAEERLTAYERFISSTRFDASIRSRLALDAALLLREKGDEEGFLKKLSQSASLDPSHKEAAMLAASYVLDRRRDPVERVDILANLLKADPIDPQVNLMLAEEFARGGAFGAARRFYGNSMTILSASGQVPETAAVDATVLLWLNDGPSAAVAAIHRQVSEARAAAARQVERQELRGQPVDPASSADRVGIEPFVARTMLLASEAAGDQAVIAGTLENLLTRLVEEISVLQDPLRRGNISEAQVQQQTVTAALFLQEIRVLSNIQIDAADRDLSNSPGLRDSLPAEYATLQGWVQLRQGRLNEALETFEPWLGVLPLAQFGHARALDELGRKDEAISSYRALIDQSPIDTFSAWSRSRIATLGAADDPAVRAALERRAVAIPAWIDRMVTRPMDFVLVRADAPVTAGEVIDRYPIRITVQNLSPLPLSLGTDRVINSRFLLAPKLESRGIGLDAFTSPESIDLQRRLRLNSREAITYDVWPDGGLTGWVIDSLANRSVRLRWRVVQGGLPTADRRFVPAPFCLESETAAITRRQLPEATVALKDMPARIQGDPISAVYRLAAAVQALVVQPILLPNWEPPEEAIVSPLKRELVPGELPPEPRVSPSAGPPPAERLAPVAAALVTRYPTLPPAERAHLLAVLPHARLSPAMAPVDEAARADTDALPLMVYLVTRVVDANDPVVEAATKHSDERVRTLAAAVAHRLGRQDEIYARFTPESLRRLAAQATQSPAPESPAPSEGTGATR